MTKMPLSTDKVVVSTKSPQPPLPTRQSESIGYFESRQFGGDKLHDKIVGLVQQSYKIGSGTVEGSAASLGNTVLSYREWAFATISALTAMGDCTDQLNTYVRAALRHGVQVEEILDLLQHAQEFCGHPRAVNALRATWPILSTAREIPLPETYRESLINLGDHDTMVCDTHGDGVPIVLIHALSCDHRMWKDILPALAASTGARVMAYDMRGHGYARGAPLITTLEQLGFDLLKLLDTLGIEKADVYGASFGGAVAQHFALDHPTRVRSLVPISTSAKGAPVLIERAEKAEAHGVHSALAETMIRWFHPETIATNPWCVRYARHCVERARLEDWASAWRCMAQLNALPRLHELKCPLMSLSGTHDVSSTPTHMKAISDACVNSVYVEFTSVENGTHMMLMEAPKDSVAPLIAFRKKVDAMLKA